MTIETHAPILASALAIMNNPAISAEGRLNAAKDVIAELALALECESACVSQGFMRYPPASPPAEPKRHVEAITIPGEMQAP